MSKLYKEKIVNYLKNESDSAELGFDREKLSYIPNYFSSYLSQGRIPNFICLVSRYGEVAHYSHQGFKNIDKKDEINNETIFRIYSVLIHLLVHLTLEIKQISLISLKVWIGLKH